MPARTEPLSATPLSRALLPKTKLTPARWCEILEGRRAMLNAHLDEIMLGQLGKLSVVPTCSGWSRGITQSTEEISKCCSDSVVNMPGAFEVKISKKGKKNIALTIWGLNKQGKWVVVTFLGKPAQKDKESHSSGFESPHYSSYNLEVESRVEVSIEEVVRVAGDPRRVWRLMRDVVKQHRTRRFQMLDRANRLERDFEQDEFLLAHLVGEMTV